jgi:alkanesulfonate monooxygenase SsuD/methylene tetrahydromethanopterin reductase-like flavin-dependent oxidoreductase (luciferase family)
MRSPMECGYGPSSEEHLTLDLVRYARRAEESGFPFALISDHFHPWIDRERLASHFEEGFLSFYEREVLPAAREPRSSRAEAVRA